MTLHEDYSVLNQLIQAASDALSVDNAIIEKDYFGTVFLKRICHKRSDIIFKGGTSLSKCYKIINRFSEDIDLSVDMSEGKLTEGKRRKLKKDIFSVVEEDDCFNILNPNEIKSRMDYNNYAIQYRKAYDSDEHLKEHLIVETAISIKACPTEMLNIASLVYDFLVGQNAHDIILKYDLEPFSVCVQSKERTFVDKVFAISDYYLSNNVSRNSRHIYDLLMLYRNIHIKDDFKDFVNEVRGLRKDRKSCLSAQEGIDTNKCLKEIIDNSFYKSDYKEVTEKLLTDIITYDQAITVLDKIIKDGYFSL